MTDYMEDLKRLIEKYTAGDGVHPTAIPSLFFIKESQISEPVSRVNEPSFCIILQGEKEVLLADESYIYGASNYIVSSVDLPVTGRVIKASAETPYLAIKLEFTPNQIAEVINDSNISITKRKKVKRAMFVSKAEPSLIDAVCRLARLVETPEDIAMLAPLFIKEIIYRILQGPNQQSLVQMTIEGSNAHCMRGIIEYIIMNYEKPFKVNELAEKVNMSVATLHRHFKETTNMSPIQFQKQLRLQEAKRILLCESTDAADVAFRVGYESPTQFSREYTRMFGCPPKEDVKRLKQMGTIY